MGAQASRLHADGTSAFQENSFIQHECRRTIRYNLSFIIP